MNLSAAAIAISMVQRPATLIREAVGHYVNGVYQRGTAAETAIFAVIQNASQDDLRILPEGERVDGYSTIWATVALRVSNEHAGTTADIVRSETGEEFRIVRAGTRPEGGFWRCIGRKIEDHGR